MQAETGIPLDVRTLVERFGTPLLVIDTRVLDGNVARFERAAARHGIEVCYAAKALFFVALARRFARTALSVDVCSLGELVTAERGGLDAQRLTFHGCGKTGEELEAVANGRVGRVVIDHRDELAALATFVRPERPVSALLRINTGIEAATHHFVRTSGQHTKFGFLPSELPDAVALASSVPGLFVAGAHGHIGSQIFEDDAFEANVTSLVDAFAELERLGAPVREISAGGGFGVHPDGQALDIERTLTTLAQTLERACRERHIRLPHFAVEPGRAIVASAGTSIYRVVTAKVRGARRFVIVDGSLADNPRPALYDAVHPPHLLARESRAPLALTTLCGRSCESDELATAPLPIDVGAGDLIAFETTGAYTFAMASNYNRFARPAVVFAGEGEPALAVRRETIDDVLAHDVEP